MNALKPRAPFQVLVMSEESRLGREAIETAYALKQLVQAGVRVFFYLEDRERTLDSPTDKIMLSLTAFADELEREKARQRTYDAMLRKAKAGHVTGGRVFGYDNVEVIGRGRQAVARRRGSTRTRPPIVRRIFALCAAGHRLQPIAKALNAEGALCAAAAARAARRRGRRRRSARCCFGRSTAAKSSGTDAASATGGGAQQHGRPRPNGSRSRRRSCASSPTRRGRRPDRLRDRGRASPARAADTRPAETAARSRVCGICCRVRAVRRVRRIVLLRIGRSHGRRAGVFLRLHRTPQRGPAVCANADRSRKTAIDARSARDARRATCSPAASSGD